MLEVLVGENSRFLEDVSENYYVREAFEVVFLGKLRRGNVDCLDVASFGFLVDKRGIAENRSSGRTTVQFDVPPRISGP